MVDGLTLKKISRWMCTSSLGWAQLGATFSFFFRFRGSSLKSIKRDVLIEARFLKLYLRIFCCMCACFVVVLVEDTRTENVVDVFASLNFVFLKHILLTTFFGTI